MSKTVIVGGVAGGMSAATRLRRLDENHEIVVLERSGYVSYANCGLPYHLGGVIGDRESLLLQSPQSLAARFALDVRVRSEVVAIDRKNRTVRVRDLDNGGEYDESYDHLVLSPGARPFVPDVPGVHRAMALCSPFCTPSARPRKAIRERRPAQRSVRSWISRPRPRSSAAAEWKWRFRWTKSSSTRYLSSSLASPCPPMAR